MRRLLGVTSFPSLLAVGVLALLAGVSVGLAQETFPSRPITFVVGFAPGGGADVLGRALADASKTTLPRPLVVENRPGAGGTNAAAYAMGRPPDGYTILFGHAGSTILTPTIGNTPNLKWDAFEPGGPDPGRGGVPLPPARVPVEDHRRGRRLRQAEPREVPGGRLGGRRDRQLRHPHVGEGGRHRRDLRPVRGRRARPRSPSSAATWTCSSGTSPTAWPTWRPSGCSRWRSPARSGARSIPTCPRSRRRAGTWCWRSGAASSRPRARPPDRIKTLADAFQKALATDSWKAFRERTQSVDLFLGPAEFRAFLAAEEARFVPLIDELGLRKK